MIKKPLVFVLVFVISVIAVHAQSNEEIARVRAISLIADAPTLQFYGNGIPMGGPVEFSVYYSYLPVPAGVYDVQVVPEGEDVSDAIISTSAEAEAGHDYTIVLMGSVEAETAQAAVINETVARTQLDSDAETLALFIHDLKGAPPVSLWVNGEPVVENVAYGEFATFGLPVGDVDSVLVTAADDPDNILLSPPFFTHFQSDVSWLLTVFGTYPGEPRQDYFLGAIPNYLGEVTTTAGGELTIGTPVDGSIDVGEQIAYSLHVEVNSPFDVLLSDPEGSGYDAYLFIFDAAGNLVAENDEISDGDEGVDAGFNGLALPAGDYSVVVTSFNNASSGMYQLQVDMVE